MEFSIKTIFTLLFLIDIFIVSIFFYYRFLIKYNADKLNIYIIGKMLQAIGILLYAILRNDIPLSLAVIIGNISAMFGIALEAYSFSIFGQQNHKKKLFWYLSITAIFSIIFLFNLKSELHTRVFIAFLCYTLLFLFAGIDLLLTKPKRRIKLSTGILLLIIAVITLFRSIDALLLGKQIQLFHQQVSEILVFLIYFLISFILAINYIFLLKEEDEDTITNSNKIFTDILNAFPDEIYVIRPDKSILYSNNQNTETDYNKEKVNCFEEKHGLKEKCEWCKLDRLSKKNRLLNHEYFNENTNRYINLSQILLNDGNIMTIKKDITEEKKVQQHIKMLSDIVEQSPDSIIVTNLEGNLEYVNKAFTEITGYSYSEAVGQNPRILQSKLVNNGDYQDLWDHIVNGKIWKGEFINKKKNGELYNEYAVIVPTFDSNGDIVNYFGIKQDITDRKNAEKLLIESEKRYRTIFEESANPVLLIKDNRFVDCNKATLDILKISSKEDFVNILLSEISPKYQPDGKLSEEKQVGLITKAYETGFNTFEWVHKNTLNENIWFDVSLTKISIKDEPYLYVEWKDITESKKAKKALKESEEKYRTLVENTNDWIWEIDKDGRFTYSNPQVYSTLGYAPEEILGKTPFDLMPETESKIVSEILNDFIKEKKNITKFENINMHKNGSQVILETSGVPFFDSNNNLLGYRGIDRDVTARKNAERTLRKNEQILDKLFKINPIPVGVLDFETLKYIRINKMFVNVFDYSAEEVIGKTPYELGLISYKHRQEINNLLIEKGSLENVELTLKNKHGKKIDGLLFTEVIEDHGTKFIYTTFIDLTEKNANREKLQTINKKLAESLEDRDILLKEVHHRVKNNMQTVHSLLFKQQRISKIDTVKVALQESMNRIVSMGLIHEQIYKTNNYKQIDFEKYIKDFSSTLFKAYEQNGKRIELICRTKSIYLSLDKAIPCALIVNELITNSIKYAFKACNYGKIIIELDNIDDTHILLSVSDDGIGLPDGFDPQKTDSLGMFIIKNITERQLQGELIIKSENGTKISVKFKK